MNSSPKTDLVVDWCSYKAAKYAVENWHYSERMPKRKLATLGVWESENFIGAVIFGYSVSPYQGIRWNLTQFQVVECVRVALKEHISEVSRIVMIAMRVLKRVNPGLRLLVSYADPNNGHHGGIYQAMGWVYMGGSAVVKQYFWRGQWRNDTRMFDYFKTHKAEKGKCRTRELLPKHKYLYPLDKAMRRQIEKLRQPYPKRAPTGGASDPTEAGGSMPTRPLQIAGQNVRVI